MNTTIYLDVENMEGCDVFLTEQFNQLWVGVCLDGNYAVGYADARQLYEELKKYFDGDKQREEE